MVQFGVAWGAELAGRDACDSDAANDVAPPSPFVCSDTCLGETQPLLVRFVERERVILSLSLHSFCAPVFVPYTGQAPLKLVLDTAPICLSALGRTARTSKKRATAPAASTRLSVSASESMCRPLKPARILLCVVAHSAVWTATSGDVLGRESFDFTIFLVTIRQARRRGRRDDPGRTVRCQGSCSGDQWNLLLSSQKGPTQDLPPLPCAMRMCNPGAVVTALPHDRN